MVELVPVGTEAKELLGNLTAAVLLSDLIHALQRILLSWLGSSGMLCDLPVRPSLVF